MKQDDFVWDLPLRLFHWLLALSFGASWLTAELRNNTDYSIDFMLLHMWLGYWMVGLLLFRIGWGLWGTTHSRFASFLRGPSAIVAYVRGLPGSGYEPGYGHNPLGALAVIAMLALLAVQVTTGLFTSDELMFAGPWVPAVSGSLSRRLSHLHESNFDWLIVMVGLHLVAIAFYWLRKGQNLIKPMITGVMDGSGEEQEARAPEIEAPHPKQRLALAFLTVLAAGAGAWAIVYFAPEPAVLFQF